MREAIIYDDISGTDQIEKVRSIFEIVRFCYELAICEIGERLSALKVLCAFYDELSPLTPILHTPDFLLLSN